MKMRGKTLKPERTYDTSIMNLASGKMSEARVVVVFAFCSLFMMMSFGITLPVFAHLFKEASSGIVLLSIMMMAPQVALLTLAPFVGKLADHYGRYPFLVLAFAGLVSTNTGNLFVHSPVSYIGIHIVQSIVCVGIRPAMMGILASNVPEQQRTRKLSILMAGFAGGLTLGPAVGGFLLQHWGVAAPFGAAAILNAVALTLICTMVPRTLAGGLQQREALQQTFGEGRHTGGRRSSLLLPFSFVVSLLLLDFLLCFGRTFFEPQFVLYITKVLRFSSFQLGLLMSGHGLAMLAGLLVVSRLGERVGRHIMIGGSMLVQAFFMLLLLFLHQFPLLFLASLLSGLGGGMVMPLLGTYYLASVKADHQSRMSGIKEACGACGGIAGSLPVILASHWLSPQFIFISAGCIAASGGFFAMHSLKISRHASFVSTNSASLLPAAIPFSSRPGQIATRQG